MNDLLNKFKAMDTSQKLLVIGVAICILTFPFYLMSGDEETANSEFDSFETPDNRNEIQDYNSKLEAYDAKREKSDNVSLEFNLDDYKDDDALGDSDEELMEREIDSLMNENKRQYSGRAKSSPRSQVSRSSNGGHRPSSSTQTDNSSQSKENVDSDFQNFFSSSPTVSSNVDSKTDGFIYAVIHGDHTIKQGERVKLRLTKKATIAGMEFSKNSYIYAFPSFGNNRVHLDINSINHVPVSISAYDTEDSAIGLYVKGAKMVGQVADETGKEAVDEVDVGGVPIGSTIKKVFQKKQQQPTVTLLNNTKLILKPNKS